MPIVIERTGGDGFEQTGILIEASAPVQNLFARAEDGIGRRDWKFAIDCLQRIIDDPEDSLVPRDEGAIEHGVLYESVRRQAIRMLHALPPEGLRAYRLLYNGKAKGLFQRGRDAHDANALRQVVDRYLLTDRGDDAADLLASWALDEGRPGEVVVLLSDLLDLCPDGDIPRELIVSKLAAAYVLLGRKQQAASVVGRFADGTPSPPDWLAALGDPEKANAILAVDGSDPGDSGRAVPARPSESLTTLAVASSSIQPTLVDPVPWRYGLGGDAVGAWRQIGAFSSGAPLALPVMSPVLTQGRFFARVPGGCVALDASDLDLLWRSSPEDSSPSGVATSVAQEREAGAAGPWEGETPFEDYVAGALAVAHGLVLTVEEPVLPTSAQPSRRGRTPREAQARMPNRLVATDAETGAVLWQHGATGDADDSLAGAVFRDTPVAVSDTLWVPYASQNDLFVGVLDPADGSLLHRIGLGSLPRTEITPTLSMRTTPMTVADGVVYVPSGQGVVFAVDAADYHLRWAHAYLQPKEESARQFVFRRAQTRRNEPVPVQITEEEHRFLPTPPVVSGGLVVVAPSDSDQVLAFSAAGGEFRWSVPGDTWSYIIGADAHRIWLGGHEVSCLSLVDGAPLWSVELSSVPTGRAALCGQTIQVPLSEGLWTIDAGTGDVVRKQPIPPSQIPLGNLACSETALFSIEPSSVRKLPDVARTIAWAHKRREEDADDLRALRELAWMYLLKDEPDSTYELLKSARADTSRDEHAAPALARIRVAALLAMAGRDDAPTEQALAWLAEAHDYATTPSERLRCSLAIADLERSAGNLAAAFETLLAAGMLEDADHPVDLGGLVTAAARVAIGRRLRELRPELSQAQRRVLERRVREGLADAADLLRHEAGSSPSWLMSKAAAAAKAKLRAAGDLLGHEPTGTVALLTLADFESSRFAYEKAEQLLFELLNGSDDARSVLAAHMRLCALYADPVYAQAGLLAPCLDALDARFGDSMVPKEYPAPIPKGLAARRFERVREWVDWVRSARSASTATSELGSASGTEASESLTVSFAEQVEPLWTLYFVGTRAEEEPSAPFDATGELKQLIDHAAPMGPPRLVAMDAPVSVAAAGPSFSSDRINRLLQASRILIHAPDDLLLCLEPRTGELLWHTALTVPDTVADSFGMVPWAPGANRRRTVHDGQTAVFHTSNGLYAAGLVTGRRLWLRPSEAARSQDAAYEDDLRMAVGHGLLAALPRPGHLALMRLYDGSTLWERDLRGEPVDRIDIVGDRIVTQDENRQRVHLFDLSDGRLVRQVLFRQPDLRSGVVSLPVVVPGAGSTTAGCICGPDSDGTTEQVVGIDVHTGEALWRVVLDKPLVQLFQPEPGYIGVGLVGGDVRVVDAATGDLVLDRRVSSVHAVIDGRMHNGTFVVQAVDARRERWEPVLVGMDIATDEELWRREDLSAQGWDVLAFRIAEGVVPSLVQFSPDGNVQSRHVGLALVDARTGENRGGVFDLTPSRSRNVYNGVFEARRDAIVVGTGAGLEALPVHGAARAAED